MSTKGEIKLTRMISLKNGKIQPTFLPVQPKPTPTPVT